MCAPTNRDAIQVRFLLRLSIVVSLTSTAIPERVRWEADGKGAYLRVRWTLEIGTSDYDGKVNGNVNSCSLVTLKQVDPSKRLQPKWQSIWDIVCSLLSSIDRNDAGV